MKKKTYRMDSGEELTDEDIEKLAEELGHAEIDWSKVEVRRGRPLLGSGPAEVVPVRLDPELRRAVRQRADDDGTTTSDVIRQALRAYIGVA